jgi:hypothetical protein
MNSIVGLDGQKASKVPKVKAVHPFRSKILVEIINGEEMIDTNLFLPDGVEDNGPPQAYIMELGPALDETCGLKPGQRVFWDGKGLAVSDPRGVEKGRVIALLELHNIHGIVEE